MKCSKCNTENRDGARFCMACGLRLATAAVAVASDEVVSAPDTTVPEEPSTPAGGPIPPEVSSQPSGEGPSGDEEPAVVTPAPEPSAPSAPEAPATDEAPPPTLPAGMPQDVMATAAEADLEEAEPPEPAVAATPVPVPTEPIQVSMPPAKELLPPLGPGTLIAGRFQAVEVLEHGAEANLYSAHDLAICPVWDDERVLSDEAYCSE